MKGIYFDESQTIGGHTFKAGTRFYILKDKAGFEYLSRTPFLCDRLQMAIVAKWLEDGGHLCELPGRREYRALHNIVQPHRVSANTDVIRLWEPWEHREERPRAASAASSRAAP